MREKLRLILSFLGVGLAISIAYVFFAAFITGLGVKNWIASFFCYLALIPAAYLGQRRITFKSNTSVGTSFPRYVATQFLGLTLSILLPYLFSSSAIAPTLQFASVAIITAVFNFVLLKIWAFRSAS
jgi:putative flippase GtrA